MTYSATADKIVKGKTFAVLLFLGVLPLMNILRSNETFSYVLFLLFAGVIVYTWLHKPTRYEVKDDKIIISRPVGNVEISINQIARIDPIHHDLLKHAVRGGAFGYFGKYDTDLGRTTWYGTRRNNIVLITKTDHTKIIVTPNEREEFIEQVEGRVWKHQTG